MTARYGVVATRFGAMYVTVDAHGRLCALTIAGTAPADLERDDAAIAHVARQLAEYETGERRTFTLPLAPAGTAFQLRVWEALCTIPFGETRSYGELARMLGDPNLMRAVGGANNANPIALVVPCHRVIGANGALVGFAGGLPLKDALLRFERDAVTGARSLFEPAL